jgi:asparagine synthase (glutamine-hydrolysing)
MSVVPTSSMMKSRDPLGLVRLYRRQADGVVAPRIRDLVAPSPPLRLLDPVGVAVAWGERPEAPQTCFAGIESLPRGFPRPRTTCAGLREALLSAAAKLVHAGEPVAVALSGGLDSALAIALLREVGASDLLLYTVSSGFPGYDEHEKAMASAAHFGLPLRVVEVGEPDFLASLPTCIAAAETPLYNLHPIERYLLARAVAADGVSALVTGDGADQVFAGHPPAIFLPIVSAFFKAAGVALRSPFFDPEVIALGLGGTLDPHKSVLRDLAATLACPSFVFSTEKQVRLTPAMNLEPFIHRRKLEKLARALGRPVTLTTDRERVRWVTLSLLWEAF